MKTKLILISALVLMLAFCITSFGGINITRNLKVRDDVTTYSVPSSLVQETGSSENVSSANQTITLKSPTFQELKDFVLADPTHRHAFVLNKYECRNFATDMVNDAVKQGIECGFVLICFDQGQHSVVAFNTTDKGLIYIEPQTNAAIEPKIGGTYMDQKINDILIAW